LELHILPTHSKHKEPQAPLEENKYGKYHIILSEAGCEG